jgi:selenocysteine-specific elongation factor
VDIGEGKSRLLYTDAGWQQLVKNMVDVITEYHRKYPLRLGIPRAEISSKVKLGALFPQFLHKLSAAGILAEEIYVVRLPGHQIRLTKDQQTRIDTYLNQLNQNPYSPSPDISLEPDLLNLLIDKGQVVKTSGGVIFSASAYNEMVNRVMSYIKQNGKITVAEARDIFQSSRKYILALLETMDEKKLTRRVGDDRVAGEKG